MQNRLVTVWTFLAVITATSWWIGYTDGTEFLSNERISAGVLIFAAIKAHLVIKYFMEVRFAPDWLQRITYGWNWGLLVLLLVLSWSKIGS